MPTDHSPADGMPDQAPGRSPESPHRIPTSLRQILFVFGVVAVAAIGFISFRGDPDEIEVQQAGAASNEDCRQRAGAAFLDTDSTNLRTNLTQDDLLAIYECLEPFETLVVVEGLPGVSGTYQSNLIIREMFEVGDFDTSAVSVFSAFADQVGQCYVASGGAPFQTKMTVTVSEDESGGFVRRVLTYDVGLSAGGEPFVGVVEDESVGGGQAETTINYVAALPRANAEIKVNVIPAPAGPRVNPNAGIAQFTSTFYNNREFFPFTSIEWEGDPLYTGVITVLCGG